MEAKSTKITYPLRNHIYVITAYSIVVFGMNLLGNAKVNLLALAMVVGINVIVFYSLNQVANRFFRYERLGPMVAQLLVLIVFWYVAVYLLIYEIFPEIGRKLFGVGSEFHLGKYIRNLTAYLEKSLLAVVIFQLHKLSKARHRALLAEKEKTIAQERQLKEEAEKQLVLQRETMRIERENMRLRFTVLAAQLKSHWLHNVTSKLREELMLSPGMMQLFDAYLDVLRYYYKHGGPDTTLVTLHDECHLVQLIKMLNEMLNDGRPTLKVEIHEPMVARQLPPFIVSTLLENAFKFANQSDDLNPISLTINSLPKALVISCWNLIDHKRAAEAPKSGVGLPSIQQQLDYFAPGANAMEILNDGVSFKITISIYY